MRAPRGRGWKTAISSCDSVDSDCVSSRSWDARPPIICGIRQLPHFDRNGVGTQNLACDERQEVPTRCETGLLERVRELGLVMQNQQVFFMGDPLRDEGDVDSVVDFPDLLPISQRTMVEQPLLRRAA